MADPTTDANEQLQALSEALRAHREILEGVSLSERARAQQEGEAAAKKAKYEAAAERAANGLRQTFEGFGKSVMSTEAGMSKYNAGIGAAGNAAMDIGSKFGILGFAIGGLVKLFTMGAELVLKQNDAMIKAYDSLSEFGQTTSLTTTDILKLGSASGYTSHNLDIFTKNAIKVSQELAGLAGSASDGLVAFGKLTQITQEQRNSYNRLGMSQEKVTQLQTDYVRQTVQSGLTLSKNVDVQRKSSLAYIDSLNQLAAITGISVEKQQAAMDVANANENFNAYIFHKGQQRDSLQDQANAAGDTARGRELQAKADEITQVINAKNEYAKSAVTYMSAGKAAAHLQSIATDGAVAFTQANANLLLSGEPIGAMAAKLNKGQSALGDLLTSQVQAAKRFDKNFGEVGYAFGEHSVELQKVFGVDNKMRQTAAEWARLTTEEDKKAFLEKISLTNKEIDDKKKGIGLIDVVKKSQNDQLSVELKARQAMDTLADTIRGPVTSVFQMLTATMTLFGKAVGKIISWVPGYKEAGQKMMEQFTDPEEVKANIENAKKEKEGLEENLKRDEALSAAKLADYTALSDKEKIAREKSIAADTKLAALKEQASKLARPGSNLQLTADIAAATKEQQAAKTDHQGAGLALQKRSLSHLGEDKTRELSIKYAKQKIKEIEAGIAESTKNYNKITGVATVKEAAVEKTMDTDPEIVAARKNLANSELLLISASNDAKVKLFEAENAGIKYSVEAEANRYKTDHDKAEFQKRLAAKLKPQTDALNALKEANLKLEKDVQERLGRELVERAKSDVESYNKSRGLTQGKRPESLQNTKVGAIGNLTESQSKNYAMTVANRESGGDISIENTLGYAGKYQFGAEALASVGALDNKKYQELKGRGLKNKEIMNDPGVWKIPGGKAAFLKDEALQDKLFALYTSQNMAGLQKAGVLNSKSSNIETAGWLSAAHLKGVGGATALFKGNDNADAYGTKASAYRALGESSQAGVEPTTVSTMMPTAVPTMNAAAASPVQVAALTPPSKAVRTTPTPADFAKTKPDANQPAPPTPAQTTPVNTIPAPSDPIQVGMTNMVNQLADRLDTVVAKLTTINDTQEAMLKYSRAA